MTNPPGHTDPSEQTLAAVGTDTHSPHTSVPPTHTGSGL